MRRPGHHNTFPNHWRAGIGYHRIGFPALPPWWNSLPPPTPGLLPPTPPQPPCPPTPPTSPTAPLPPLPPGGPFPPSAPHPPHPTPPPSYPPPPPPPPPTPLTPDLPPPGPPGPPEGPRPPRPPPPSSVEVEPPSSVREGPKMSGGIQDQRPRPYLASSYDGAADSYYSSLNPYYSSGDAYYSTANPYYSSGDAYYSTANPYYSNSNPYYSSYNPYYHNYQTVSNVEDCPPGTQYAFAYGWLNRPTTPYCPIPIRKPWPPKTVHKPKDKPFRPRDFAVRFPSAYTMIHIIYEDGSSPTQPQSVSFVQNLLHGTDRLVFNYAIAEVDTAWSLRRFVDTVTSGEAAKAEKGDKKSKKVALTEVVEMGEGNWRRRGTIPYGDDRMNLCLDNVGWTKKRGGRGEEMVWCVVHAMEKPEKKPPKPERIRDPWA